MGLRDRWNGRLTGNIGSGDEVLIVEEPSGRLPWGLGCVACFRYFEYLKSNVSLSSSSAVPADPELAAADRKWVTFQVGSQSGMLHIADLLRHLNSGLTVNAFHSRAMAHFNRQHADAPDVDRPLVIKAERGCIDRDDESVAKTDHGHCRRHGVANKASRELDVLNLHTRVFSDLAKFTPPCGADHRNTGPRHTSHSRLVAIGTSASCLQVAAHPSGFGLPNRTHTHDGMISSPGTRLLCVCVCLHLVPRNSLRYWKPAWKRNRRAMRLHRGR